MKRRLLQILAVLALALIAGACAAPQPQVITVVVTSDAPTPVPSDTPAPSPTPEPSATNQPSATPAPTATTGPQCTVQQRLNFRSGPGTAYVPILGVFDTGSVLVPSGYNPTGSPDGAWVQVTNPQDNRLGWVSAGPAFVQCNIDLTGLPPVAVQPPPTPSAPRVSNKPPEGPQGGDIQFDIVMDPNYLMQIRARIDGTGSNGDGIDQVFFTIERNGETVYEESEANPAFCIFKGGEPNCNPWPRENGRYTWGAGGPLVQTGDYLATIVVTRDADGSSAQWTFTFTVDLP